MSLRSPLARVRGLGSAKDGVGHWWAQRVTACALVLLILWFVLSMLTIARADYVVFKAWISTPINTTLMVLTLFTAFYHAMLGLQVVIEDYIHEEANKLVALLAMKFVLIFLGTSAVLAVLRCAFGG